MKGRRLAWLFLTGTLELAALRGEQLRSQGRPPAPARSALELEAQKTAGRVRFSRHDYAGAAAAFRTALLLDPANEDLRTLLSEALLAKALRDGSTALDRNDWESARDAFRSGVELDPESHPARDGLREAQYQILLREGMRQDADGRIANAIRAYENCLLLKPGDDAAARRLSLLRERVADTARARAVFNDIPKLLRSGQWSTLHRELAQAVAAGQEAPAGAVTASALLASARRDFRTAAELLSVSQEDAVLRREASRYVASRRRWSYAGRGALPIALAYLGCLTGTIFLGLRQALRREDGRS
jgi:tetratricopeptide (TPR) repeat protein